MHKMISVASRVRNTAKTAALTCVLHNSMSVSTIGAAGLTMSSPLTISAALDPDWNSGSPTRQHVDYHSAEPFERAGGQHAGQMPAVVRARGHVVAGCGAVVGHGSGVRDAR